MGNEEENHLAPRKTIKRRSSKRKKNEIDESQLPQEELLRRKRQRELREIAIKLRNQGKDYNPKKYRKKEFMNKMTGGVIREDYKPRRHVDVIIVPIVWNKREEEKALVFGVASQAQIALRTAGIKCDTDTTTKLTPGQKFRHWEEKGVMVRIEVGPQEAEAGACVLAKCETAGQVAQKKRVALGETLLQAVCQALGYDELDEETMKAAVDACKELGEKNKQALSKLTTQVGIGHADASAPAHRSQRGLKIYSDNGTMNQGANTKIIFSGDDLDGDFDGVNVMQGDAEGGKKIKGKIGEVGADDDVEQKTRNEKTKKKIHKVVKF